MAVQLAQVMPLLEKRQAEYQSFKKKVGPGDDILPLSLRYSLRGATAAEWGVAMVIWHHTLVQAHLDPISISFKEFASESGLTKPTICRALLRLQDRGLLYEETDTPQRRSSLSRYALLDTHYNEPGPFWLEDGSVAAILLVAHLYRVSVDSIKQRVAPQPITEMLPRSRLSLTEAQRRLAILPALRGPLPKNWAALRERIFARDNYTCFYCERENFYPLHCDHVIPIVRGGSKHDPSNLVTACGSCNASKGDLLLEEWLA